MDSETMTNLKTILREDDIPFFSDPQLQFYYTKNNQDFNMTVYECLLIKAEPTTLSISGLATTDTSVYFRRLAARYRPNHSGIIQGGY